MAVMTVAMAVNGLPKAFELPVGAAKSGRSGVRVYYSYQFSQLKQMAVILHARRTYAW